MNRQRCDSESIAVIGDSHTRGLYHALQAMSSGAVDFRKLLSARGNLLSRSRSGIPVTRLYYVFDGPFPVAFGSIRTQVCLNASSAHPDPSCAAIRALFRDLLKRPPKVCEALKPKPRRRVNFVIGFGAWAASSCFTVESFVASACEFRDVLLRDVVDAVPQLETKFTFLGPASFPHVRLNDYRRTDKRHMWLRMSDARLGLFLQVARQILGKEGDRICGRRGHALLHRELPVTFLPFFEITQPYQEFAHWGRNNAHHYDGSFVMFEMANMVRAATLCGH
jgi:hypothetical protein